jgi:phosphoserine phosphatase
VYVVTASVKWAVEPAAALVGVDADHVLGITTKIVGGRVTTEPIYPVTWREGKAEALLAATKGHPPILAAGNTYGDIPLISLATHIPLAVSTQEERNELYEEEDRLRVEATARGWKRHGFR